MNLTFECIFPQKKPSKNWQPAFEIHGVKLQQILGAKNMISHKNPKNVISHKNPKNVISHKNPQKMWGLYLGLVGLLCRSNLWKVLHLRRRPPRPRSTARWEEKLRRRGEDRNTMSNGCGVAWSNRCQTEGKLV